MKMGRTQIAIRLLIAVALVVFIYYNLFTGGQGPR